MTIRSYEELITFETFEDRFEYLRLDGDIGVVTFGSARYFNQNLYRSNLWKHIRNQVILRDNGCDLGILDREIHSRLMIHHINPITLEDIERNAECIFNLNNLITTTMMTHNAIHYGDISLLPQGPIERQKNDTCPWAWR